MQINIREASQTDSLKIVHLHVDSLRATYRGMLSDEYLENKVVSDCNAQWEERLLNPVADQLIFIAEIDKIIVGFICCYGNSDPEFGTFISNLHVSPHYKRKGIGTKLLVHLASYITKHYFDNGLWLWVRELNVTAQIFYQRLGAENIEQSMIKTADGSSVLMFRYVWRNPKLAEESFTNFSATALLHTHRGHCPREEKQPEMMEKL